MNAPTLSNKTFRKNIPDKLHGSNKMYIFATRLKT